MYDIKFKADNNRFTYTSLSDDEQYVKKYFFEQYVPKYFKNDKIEIIEIKRY